MTLGELRARSDPANPANLIFTDPTTDLAVMGYRDLKVWDADGKQLAAHMRATGEGPLIAINDDGAGYPLTVDPLVVSLDQELDAGRNTRGNPYSVAISADTLVLGFPEAEGRRGEARVMKRMPSGWVLQATLSTPLLQANDSFGASVAIEGDTIVIGKPGRGSRPAVVVFVKSGDFWIEQAKLAEGFGPTGFGYSVAIQGNRLVVGEPGTFPGIVKVFQRSGTSWSLQATFGGAANSLFDYSVALDGDLVVIGAPGTYPGGSGGGSGSVFVYQSVGALWLDPVGILRNPRAGSSGTDRFGASVGISGTTIAASAPAEDFSQISQDIGSLYLFEQNGSTWTESARLQSSTPVVNDRFGMALSLLGNTLAARGLNSTAVFIRAGGSWSLAAEATATDNATGNLDNFDFASIGLSAERVLRITKTRIETLAFSGGVWSAGISFDVGGYGGAGDDFGLAIDLDSKAAVIGALNDDTPAGSNAGSAYIFRRSGTLWGYEAKILDSEGAAEDRFGVSVSISGETVVIGADFDDAGALNGAGSVTVYFRNAGVWTRQGGKISGTGTNRNLGRSVAIDGDSFLVGEPASSGAGRAYFYQRTGSAWTLLSTVTSPVPGSAFGYAVALQGNRAIVGDPLRDQTGAVDAGWAYTFKRTAPGAAWVLDQPLGAPTPERGTRFGFSVALDGNRIAIGAPGLPAGWTGGVAPAAGYQGKAFTSVHDGTNWTPLVAAVSGLFVRPFENGYYFGFAMELKGDLLVISAPGYNLISESGGQTQRIGIVELFRFQSGSWARQDLEDGVNSDFYPLDEELDNDGFYGSALALSGESLLVGAYRYSNGFGHVYGYRITDSEAGVPSLSISRSGANIVLTWTPAAGWSLYRSSSLLLHSWQPVTVATDGSYNSPISSAARMFFRLQRP